VLADHNDHYALVVRRNAELIGLAELHRTGARGGDLGMIVEDTFQGRGIGTAALQVLIRRAREQGLRFVTADVFLENIAVIAWLRRLGGAAVGREHDVCHIKLDLVTERRSLAESQSCVA
jgi:RimJ/RimL family protein N-acetyltransferase